MINETLIGSGRTIGTLSYISPLAFMYSRVPLLLSFLKPTGRVTVTVTNQDTGESFQETRSTYNNKASFDLSRIMLYLAPDATSLLSESRAGLAAYTAFSVSLSIGSVEAWSLPFVGIYGALNANEFYRYNSEGLRGPVNRRLWVNFPQTFQIQIDESDEFYYQTEAGSKIYPERLNSDNFAYEDYLVQSLSALSDYDIDANSLLLQLKSGNAQTVGLSTDRAINAQAEVVGGNAPFWLRLHPDLTRRDATGVTYLRWLQRDGSIGYWLFRSGELQTTSEEAASFQRYNENPNVSSYWDDFLHFDGNQLHADYAETRTLNLSAEIRNRDEFEYLCGLLTSPVVDRLVDSETHEGWERVNIMPSSQGLSLRRDTPFSRTLELAIQLPRRDTIKL
jgi:hypothetical protein